MVAQVSTASEGYKQNPLPDWYLHCTDIAGIQSSRMSCTLDPHGQLGFNSIKGIEANPLQCWYLH